MRHLTGEAAVHLASALVTIVPVTNGASAGGAEVVAVVAKVDVMGVSWLGGRDSVGQVALDRLGLSVGKTLVCVSLHLENIETKKN